jgi:hypothetical protein
MELGMHKRHYSQPTPPDPLDRDRLEAKASWRRKSVPLKMIYGGHQLDPANGNDQKCGTSLFVTLDGKS